ncbi:bifunctional riboflavin kinase/FAD synthetase [Brooklawnia propionicigenes]|uniref:Riboflavin biosynthesis protein n=1 Tax=Brooklawnia propionicigenes TaxID=3041175 RepID=A0AAN0K5Y9_9ACTN|nr:bifunctional riboflavin kinase/FAD synthetase [Brooklawnia sp. SH051]BEH01142.1 bifunctional riboflavin kinase/FAD synthetase [Brooklawnia sp. SH051]
MRRSVVAIGNFDGVHTGHQQLLRTAVEHAQELGTEREPLQVIVVTFWPHPMSVVAPGHQPLLLTSLSDRIDLLRRYGADEVRVVQFTRDVAAWSPQKFVDTILGPLDPAVVVVGENFTFGNRAAGTPQMMREFGKGRFDVDIIHLVSIDSERTCSSFVRSALATGDVAAAARHLGRLFRLSGVVVVGDQRGRELGFPTANLPVAADLATPADGVYAGWLRRLDQPSAIRMPAAISVGTNPTFDGVERRVESYVLDRTDLELYGINIAVEFVEHLRGQVRFGSIDELIEQMNKDVAATRAVLGID